jgi:hypothetical protein
MSCPVIGEDDLRKFCLRRFVQLNRNDDDSLTGIRALKKEKNQALWNPIFFSHPWKLKNVSSDL